MASAAATSRLATHAGSWYEKDADALRKQFDNWLAAAASDSKPIDPKTARVRAIISPHAGYSYSGPTAAYGFQHLSGSGARRVFILGPSHHHYTKQCELSRHATYDTPLGALRLDAEVQAALRASGKFGDMARDVDEAEHSIELQLPFLAHVMSKASREWTIVPILVGALSSKAEEEYATVLAPYFADPQNVFVFSSDFCHWGQRFRYTPTEAGRPIYDAIERLDRRGMTLIEAQDAKGFEAYLKQEQNTICGRHPIGVMLKMLAHLPSPKHQVQVLHYAQSSRAKSMHDSSVSYVSAIVTAEVSK